MANGIATGRAFGPTEPGRRIVSVDMVRGFALFGVLLVNMYNFGASSPIWTSPPDEFVFAVKRFFFETKSWRLFSFLFGFGFALQMLRADERGRPFLPVYVRRLVILFGFGAMHALLYDGDILMLYAELGLLLVLFRRVPLRLLLVLALLLLLAFPVERLAFSLWPAGDPVAEQVTPRDEEPEIDVARARRIVSSGSIGEVMALNAWVIPPKPWKDLRGPESSLGFFAMFLLGLYAGRRRVFQDRREHRGLVANTAKWGLAVGLFSMIGVDPLSRTVNGLGFHAAASCCSS